MAHPPRHPDARTGFVARQPGARRRRPGGGRAADRPRPDGRAVPGLRASRARLAGAGGLRMTITYRDAVPGDGATLDRLFDTSFCDTFAHLYKAEDLDAFLNSFGVDDWEEQLKDPAFACRIAEV